MVQPIIPKFIPNWTQPIRFDRIQVNVAGTALTPQTVSTKWSAKSPRDSSGKSKTTRTTRSGTYGGLIGKSLPKYS